MCVSYILKNHFPTKFAMGWMSFLSSPEYEKKKTIQEQFPLGLTQCELGLIKNPI